MKKETAIEASKLLSDIKNVSKMIDDFHTVAFIDIRGFQMQATHEDWGYRIDNNDPRFIATLRGLEYLRTTYEQQLKKL